MMDGALYVNGQTFSSDFHSTDRGSIVKAMFIMKDNGNFYPYFGIIFSRYIKSIQAERQ